MERRRRSANDVEGDREARSIALALGRVVRDARRRRRLTQGQLGAAVGLRRSRISEIEGGLATGTPLVVLVRLGMVLSATARDRVQPRPRAGPPRGCRPPRGTGAGPSPGAANGPAGTGRAPHATGRPIPVGRRCLRDDTNRTLILQRDLEPLRRLRPSRPVDRPEDRRVPCARRWPWRRAAIPRGRVLAPRRQWPEPGPRRPLSGGPRGTIPGLVACLGPGPDRRRARSQRARARLDRPSREPSGTDAPPDRRRPRLDSIP